MKKARDIINEYDKKYDRYKKSSVLSKFNKGEITKDKILLDIVKKYKNMDGSIKKYYNLNMKNLLDLWNFDGGGNIPPKKKIKEELKNIRKSKILIRKNEIKLKGKSGVELGGLLKGYLLDKVSNLFDNSGISEYIINLGGDVAIKGKNIKVGVKSPDKNGVVSYILLKGKQNLKIVTSGDYERYFEKRNKRYHHILNPTTGYPSRGIKSLTYIGKNGFIADIYSTAIFSMGRKKALKYIKKIDKAGVLILDKKNKFHKRNLKEGEDENGRLFFQYR